MQPFFNFNCAGLTLHMQGKFPVEEVYLLL